ncbi:hypothetical protein BC826DRAFT_34342 [Russula brevipes]|nr:hypothetical protein BC826DRAFT_34342 [Russula brevipes]
MVALAAAGHYEIRTTLYGVQLNRTHHHRGYVHCLWSFSIITMALVAAGHYGIRTTLCVTQSKHIMATCFDYGDQITASARMGQSDVLEELRLWFGVTWQVGIRTANEQIQPELPEAPPPWSRTREICSYSQKRVNREAVILEEPTCSSVSFHDSFGICSVCNAAEVAIITAAARTRMCRLVIDKGKTRKLFGSKERVVRMSGLGCRT